MVTPIPCPPLQSPTCSRDTKRLYRCQQLIKQTRSMKATWPITVHFAADNLFAPPPTKALVCTMSQHTIHHRHTHEGRGGREGREDCCLFNIERLAFLCQLFILSLFLFSVLRHFCIVQKYSPQFKPLRVPMATPIVSEFPRSISFFLSSTLQRTLALHHVETGTDVATPH